MVITNINESPPDIRDLKQTDRIALLLSCLRDLPRKRGRDVDSSRAHQRDLPASHQVW